MKLVITIVHDEDSNDLLKNLLEHDFGVTKLASTGGFLKSGNTTMLIGTEENRIDQLLKLIEESCKTRKTITTTSAMFTEAPVIGMPIEVTVGGATIFILDVEKNIKL